MSTRLEYKNQDSKYRKKEHSNRIETQSKSSRNTTYTNT